jgi:diguanylate cyclase (GGDEF)-like protein
VNGFLQFLRLESIRHRILAFAVLATLLPSIATAWISFSQQKHALTLRVAEDLETASQGAKAEVDHWTRDRVLDLRVFASSYEVSETLERGFRTGGASRLDDYLRSVGGKFAVFDAITVLDPRGTVVASSGASRRAPPLPDGWRTDLSGGQAVIRTIRGDETGGRTLLTLGVPIMRSDLRLLGAITATIDLARLRDVLAEHRPGPSGRLLLLDEEGSVILKVGPDSAAAPNARVEAPLVGRLTRAEGPLEYRGVEGLEVLGRLRSISRPPWLLVAEIPAAEAYRQVNDLRNLTVMLLVVVLLGVGLLAYRLSLLIVRPLDRLTAGAEKVAGGDLSVDLPVTGGGEVGLLTRVFNDMVTKIREARQELERLSLTDGLTGLYNRRHLMAALDTEVRRVKRLNGQFSLLLMDVDHFKRYNDTYGHQAGDEVLRGVAAVIRGTVREVDTAARYGGEEMVAMLPDTTIEGALELAERIRTRLAEEDFPGGKVTLSIGAATFPEYGETVESLIAGADAALYQAKREGRDRVIRARRRRSREMKSG